ncbi:MAG: hypothetical protein E6929_09615 [Clostridium sp.]|nr:hypothetical protein [Clostridium sp.]
MKKRLYSLFVIIFSVLDIIFMIKIYDFEKNKDELNESNNIVNCGEVQLNNEESSLDYDTGEINTEEKINNDQKTSEDKVELDEEKSKRFNRASSRYETDQEINNSKQVEIDIAAVKEESKVLKMPISKIEDSLSIAEKAKILSVCKKLSEQDYKYIAQYANYDNEKIAVSKTLDILENRLTDEQLEEVKEIFSDYIDFSKVED